MLSFVQAYSFVGTPLALGTYIGDSYDLARPGDGIVMVR